MALTRVAAAGINTGGTFVLENVNTSGIVTAGTVQVGAATTIHSGGIDLGGGNITSHNINSTGIITATGGFVGAVTGNVTGNLTGNVTGDLTGNVTGNVTGNLTGNVTGNVTSSGANTLGSLTVTNDATVGGALTITGNLTVNGTTTTIDTAVTAVDSLAIDGDASVGGALTATGNITANAFYGDGSNLTGIDATQIQTGNTSVQTVDTGSDGHVKVTTEGSERLRITSSGLVGIGTDTPDCKLEISNDGYAFPSPAGSSHLRVGNGGGSATIDIAAANTQVSGVYFSDTDATARGVVAYHHNGNYLFFSTNDGTERLRIDSGGKVNNFINDSTTYSASSTPHNGIQVWNQNDTTNTFAALRLTAGNSGPATVQINSIREASGASALAIQVESSNTPAEALRITSAGRMGLGTANPSSILTCESSSDLSITVTKSGVASLRLGFDTNGAYVEGVGGGQHLGFRAGNSERARIDNSGRLLVGSTSSRNDFYVAGTYNPQIQNEGINLSTSMISNVTNSNNSYGSYLILGKSRGTSAGSNTLVQSGDDIGIVDFLAADGAKMCHAAQIKAMVDSTPSESDMPTRLTFATTQDGESSPRERWRISSEGILTNQSGNHAHGSQDFINNYRCQFGVYASAEAGTNGNSAVGTGPFDSTYQQSEWDNKTLTYGMAQELRSEYNLSQTSRCNIGASFFAGNTAGNDNSFPDGGGSSTYWTPYSVGVWARGANNGGYQGYAGVRADCQGYYGSSVAYYARVKSSPTSGRGHGFHCDLGGHVFGNNNVGYYVRQIDDQQQTGCTGFVYRRHNSSNTFNVLEVRNSSNSTIGSIRCSNSNTSFNTSSDYRLKENVTSVTNGIEILKQMPVKTFNFIGDTETITGFLAHEIQDVAPYAVSGVKDGTKEVPATDENDQPILSDEEVDGVKQPVMETVPDYQSVDYGKLTPILTAALQEAIAKIETLEAQNAELVARLDAAGL